MPDKKKTILCGLGTTDRRELYVTWIKGLANITDLTVYDQLKDPNDTMEEFENCIFLLKEEGNDI